MTTPSIRETLLAFARDMARVATNQKNLDDINNELRLLAASPVPFAQALLETERSRVMRRIDEYERDAIQTAAALLCLRTGEGGECDIDKPAIRPKGKPTKAESAARGVKDTDQPADRPAFAKSPESPTGDPQADATLATAADAFVATISDDRTPEQARLVLADRGWHVGDMDLLTPTALIEVARRCLRPEQTETNADGSVTVAGGEVIS